MQKERKKMKEKKQMNKKALLGVAVLVVVVAVMGILYNVYREKPVAGSKAITIEVVNKEKESTVYEVKTDAEYLLQAMEEAEGLTFDGYESEFGFSITAINDIVADFNVDSSYWGFYVNGEYCNYGISSQPVEDGDSFQIVYEVYVAQ